jgi:AraC family transcriptional regulator
MQLQRHPGDDGHPVPNAQPRMLVVGVPQDGPDLPELPQDAGRFLLLLRGQARCHCRYGRFDLQAGSWLSIDGGEVRIDAVTPGALLLVLAVHPRLVPWFHDLPEAPVFFLGSGRAGRALRQAALRAWRLAMMPGPGANARVHRAICAIQASMLSDIARCPGYKTSSKRSVYLRMQRARLRLEGSPDRATRISELALESGLSLWYFSKLFHVLHGVTPQRYGMQVRLAHAQTLLATTSMEIADVGMACGFENPCSFARAFRASFGEAASLHRLRGRSPSARAMGMKEPR